MLCCRLGRPWRRFSACALLRWAWRLDRLKTVRDTQLNALRIACTVLATTCRRWRCAALWCCGCGLPIGMVSSQGGSAACSSCCGCWLSVMTVSLDLVRPTLAWRRSPALRRPATGTGARLRSICVVCASTYDLNACVLVYFPAMCLPVTSVSNEHLMFKFITLCDNWIHFRKPLPWRRAALHQRALCWPAARRKKAPTRHLQRVGAGSLLPPSDQLG